MFSDWYGRSYAENFHLASLITLSKIIARALKTKKKKRG
jgi:hypothetical protein